MADSSSPSAPADSTSSLGSAGDWTFEFKEADGTTRTIDQKERIKILDDILKIRRDFLALGPLATKEWFQKYARAWKLVTFVMHHYLVHDNESENDDLVRIRERQIVDVRQYDVNYAEDLEKDLLVFKVAMERWWASQPTTKRNMTFTEYQKIINAYSKPFFFADYKHLWLEIGDLWNTV